MSGPCPPASPAASRQSLARRYRAVRNFTESLCRPLVPDDYCLQSMADASPPKWHLGHTTWFFETFVLEAADPTRQPFDARFPYLFNSYYHTVGRQLPQPQRGLLTRPTVETVYRYRETVDRLVAAWIQEAETGELARLAPVLETGLHHEQQHQELLLTDLKHGLACNPIEPAYMDAEGAAEREAPPGAAEPGWLTHPGGEVNIGHEGEGERGGGGGGGFAYDHEGPAHTVRLEPFAVADRLVSAGDFKRFIDDGGYRRHELWLDDGWQRIRAEDRTGPLYWAPEGDDWSLYTLAGRRPVEDAEPVCHVDFFEADAYARWAGCRLPGEAEWEALARAHPGATLERGHFAESGRFHPAPDAPGALFGHVWTWTGSAYRPYPRYRPPAGAIGEYNGKFMSGRFVLRGGSCLSPAGHLRATYRNFFPPETRWQMTGIRLARHA